MAKDKTKKRIPKTIAGVKLPKDLRRTGNAILAKAATAEGQAMIAGGLSIAAAAIAASSQRARPAASPATGASEPSAAPTGIPDPQALADAVGSAVEGVIARFLSRPR